MPRIQRAAGACLFLFTAGLLAACASESGTPSPAGKPAGTLTVTSEAFAQGEAIPARYTCSGEDTSPPLAWSAPPQGTLSLALIMDDPDAPAGTWTHWVLYNLPPETTALVEGASAAKASRFDLPESAVQGRTSFRRADYGGPCPPSGTHRYFFRVYALDTTIADTALDAKGLRAAMDGHVLAQGELMGTFKR